MKKKCVPFLYKTERISDFYFVVLHVVSNYLSLLKALILTIFEEKGLGDTFKI